MNLKPDLININPSHKLKKLESLRGFAAIYVVFHHINPKLVINNINFSFLFRFGQEAVILFFFVSGFVIFYSYSISKDKSFKLFFLKRFLRIYIPLIIVFIVHYLLLCYYNKAIITIDPKILGGNLLMLQDSTGMIPNTLFPTFLNNAPLWSLSYEWWFYMLFFVIYNKFKNKASIIVYITGFIATITYLIYPNFINRELMYLVIWWSGADIASAYLSKKEINLKTFKLPLIALLSCTIALFINILIQDKLKLNGLTFVSPWLEFRHFIFAFFALLSGILWKKLNWIGFSKTFGPFSLIAPISYTIYISHWFLINNAHYLDGVINNIFLRYTCYFLICIIFSYIVERKIFPRINNAIIKNFSRKLLE